MEERGDNHELAEQTVCKAEETSTDEQRKRDQTVKVNDSVVALKGIARQGNVGE